MSSDRATDGARRRSRARRSRFGVLLAAVIAAFAMTAVATPAALGAQAWRIDSLSNSTAAPGSTLTYVVQASSIGDAAMDGSQISIEADLPAGMTAVDASYVPDEFNDANTTAPCTAGDGVSPVAGATTVVCTSTVALPPTLRQSGQNSQVLTLTVNVDPSASGTLTSVFSVQGGGAPSAQTVDPTTVSSAPIGFGVDAFDGQIVDASGAAVTQAGAHPADATVGLDLNTHTDPVPQAGDASPVEPLKDVLVDLPPGFIGDPTATDRCTSAQLAFTLGLDGRPQCPSTSQVGTVVLRMNNRPFGGSIVGPIPVFNIVPPPNVPARFGFNISGTVVVLDGSLRTGGDYGLSIDTRNTSEALAISGTIFTFWGVPSEASHDLERACPGQVPPGLGGPNCVSGAPRVAFLRNPTSCTAPGVGITTTVNVDSWTHPGDFKTARFDSHLLPGFPSPPSAWGARTGPTGCDRVPFEPRFDGEPGTPKSNTPSGFAFDLSLPQTDDPDVIGQADLRKAVVTLPAGVRVNPSAADGLQACSPDQINLHGTADPTCPEASKIGTVTIHTPLLTDPLDGSIYLASPHDNPFGTLLSIYLVADGPGVVIKLAGRVDADPITGQLTATFDDNPQTPFDSLHLEFDGGSHAQLVTPRECGDRTTLATLTGWNGSVVQSNSTFTISGDGKGAPCPAPRFSPGYSLGTESNSAGTRSPLHVRLTRDDADENLSTFTVDDIPPGMIAYTTIPNECSDAAANAGTCGDAAKIGDVTVGAGAGANPFYITNGNVYFTGPYKGAPFGLSIVVPAVAGPFNLGNVVVRSAIFVDKHTSQLRIVTDPLPTILQGIPLDVRDIRVAINRKDFTVNPTNCNALSSKATVGSTDGMTAHVSDRFQAADCASLGFKPRMVLRVGGRGHTYRNATTPLSTTLTMPSSRQANLRYVRVTLPQSINARLTVINDACTRAQFETDIAKCAHAIAGRASAITPVLRDPLKGNVYFVRNGHPIPDLFVALRGQVAFDLIGRVTIPGGKRLATTFDAAPDVPIRSFTLRLLGDRKNGSVGAAKNLCSASARKQKAELDYIAQSGKVFQTDQRLLVSGCKKAKHRRAKKRHGR